MLARIWSNKNFHSLLVEMQNDTTTSEGTLAVSYKTKYTLTTQSSNHAPRYVPKRVENLYPYINLHTDVYSSCIHNCSN